MAITKGRRRKDQSKLSEAIPVNPRPGDYWKVIKSEGGNPEWWIKTPNGLLGRLGLHTVEEHEDRTISVVSNPARDGHQNSILVSGVRAKQPVQWHGWIKHGVWGESMQELNEAVSDAD